MKRPSFGRRGTFWSSAAVLALVLWASGSPSVLYPLYADQWGLTPAVVTAVFATSPITLLIVLLLFGGLSDTFGRRRVMILGVALFAASAIIFALAPHVGFLFAGRVLQGAGSGLAMGAASAALVENNVSQNPRFASSFATVSTSTGLTAALVISGALVQFAPLPLVLSYAVLLTLCVAVIIALALTPDDRNAEAAPWRPVPPRLAPRIRLVFAIAALSVALAYGVGAIFLALGAEMIRQFADTENHLVVGLLLGCSSAAIGVTGLLLARVQARPAATLGALLSLVSLVGMVLVAEAGSIPLFLVWCIVGGAAYSFAFTGGLGLINQAAPENHRGGTLSLVYLVAYLLQAGTAIGVGALATTSGLRMAVTVGAAALGLVCVAVLVLVLFARRHDVDAGRYRHRRHPGRPSGGRAHHL